MRPLVPLFACVATLLTATALHAEVWTLDRALTAAREGNPDARIARLRIEGAQAVEQQARAAWLPQLSVQGGYSASNRSMPAFGYILNQRAFTWTTDFNHPGTIDDLNATGTVAYNLYSGGRATAHRAAAKAGAQAAEHDATAVRQQLETATVRAYLNLRQARAAADALASGVRAYEAAVAVAQARFDAGQLLKADLLNLEVQLAQTRETLSAARHQAALAERAFLFVLGREKATDGVELPADDPAFARLVAPTTSDPARRPELAAMEARVRAAEAMVRAARSGRQPTVNAFASYGYDHGWQLNAHADGWTAGVAVEMNLFDGGQTSGKIRQAQSELAQAQELRRKLQLALSLEVEQARLAHADATERLAVSARAVEQAEESASLSRARFEQGALLSADLIGVETRRLEAIVRHAAATADAHLALADLRRALGLPLFE